MHNRRSLDCRAYALFVDRLPPREKIRRQANPKQWAVVLEGRKRMPHAVVTG